MNYSTTSTGNAIEFVSNKLYIYINLKKLMIM